jgi:hypothetical protein
VHGCFGAEHAQPIENFQQCGIFLQMPPLFCNTATQFSATLFHFSWFQDFQLQKHSSPAPTSSLIPVRLIPFRRCQPHRD